VIHYDNACKIKKQLSTVKLNAYERTFVCIQDFWSDFLLEVISQCYKEFTTSYCCYLMAPGPKHYEQHQSSTLLVKVCFAPHSSAPVLLIVMSSRISLISLYKTCLYSKRPN